MLELRKLAMYKSYYYFVKKKCKIHILYSTNIPHYFCEIMLKDKELFDLSNFPKGSKYFS